MSKTIHPNLDVPFEIQVGDTAQVSNGTEITILNVEDSRCPANVLCVWQGEAKISINVIKDSQDLGNFVLSTLEEKTIQTFDSFTIKLVEVQPYPYSNKEITLSDYVVTLVVSDTHTVVSPLKQYLGGIPIDKIVCSAELQLVMKKTDGKPACVKPDSVAKLIERGWAVHVLPEYVKDEPKNSDIFELGKYQITTDTINYNNSTGFLARPTESGKFPGVILIHEWWGLNDNIKDMARNLASHGYTVFAADLYGGQVATTPDGAREILTTFDAEKGVSNIQGVAELLRTKYEIGRLATIGWCFGGTQSLNYALSGNDLDATIIYYGQPVTDQARLSVIHWPVLGIFGGQDQSITTETVNKFESILNDLGIENEIYIYPDVGHAFANPSGANYAPQETKDAWQNTLLFLEKHLKT
ncbi:MAG TPA: dienelactone hydrolase family protein [Nitrosopumilaceae archaeon]|nr:dienelactone hydrolase family protein [Nitrosopumilaceae archaeon]